MVAADVREFLARFRDKNLASGVDREIYAGNQRIFELQGPYNGGRCPLSIAYPNLSIRCDESPIRWRPGYYRLAHVTGVSHRLHLFSARVIDPQGRAHTRSARRTSPASGIPRAL